MSGYTETVVLAWLERPGGQTDFPPSWRGPRVGLKRSPRGYYLDWIDNNGTVVMRGEMSIESLRMLLSMAAELEGVEQ